MLPRTGTELVFQDGFNGAHWHCSRHVHQSITFRDLHVHAHWSFMILATDWHGPRVPGWVWWFALALFQGLHADPGCMHTCPSRSEISIYIYMGMQIVASDWHGSRVPGWAWCCALALFQGMHADPGCMQTCPTHSEIPMCMYIGVS